ncbi:bardet-biedl syndrome protein 5 [Holotrichia oblita]|uniref:Bardet-biedl syndrome protein 5 n=1 Tax=Holotrichia oblita TaxID=644536 RepID=A0ACB9TJ57_HOLOL|nr:bardet-biedl syndrome protein 5 [Holotrichia oblita]
MQNIETKPVNQTYIVDCNKLRMGQYMCPDPRISQIDLKTQQFKGCTKENKAKVICVAVEGLICKESKNTSFTKENALATNRYYSDSYASGRAAGWFIDVMPYYGPQLEIIRSNNWT